MLLYVAFHADTILRNFARGFFFNIRHLSGISDPGQLDIVT